MTRAVFTLLAALVLAGLGLANARNLELDTGVEALLPSDSVSVVSIEKTRDELGIEEPLTILVASDDVERNKALTAHLGAELSTWPETQWVMTSYGLDRLAERALYYVDAETLDEWSELAEEALDWEVCKVSPVCVTIADPPELPDSDDVRAAVDASPAGQLLLELTGTSAKKAGIDAAGDAQTALCDDDGSVCAVQAMLDGSPGDLGFARMIKERAEAILEPLELAQPEETRIRVIGRYRVAPLEHSIVLDDLRLVAVLAAIGSLLLVLVFFRDLTAFFQLAVPMLSGLAVAVGLIVLIEPKLNIISASALAILAGMAIDFGIHLLMHYQSARGAGLSPLAAAKASVRELWVSLLVAGATTACGFAALSITDFQGFSQMGWMASLGIIVTLLWTLAVFPSVVHLLPGTKTPGHQRSAKPAGNRKLAVVGLVLGLLATALAVNVEFERNLGELQPEIVDHGINADVMRARRNINALYLGATRGDVDRALRSEAMTKRGLEIMGVEPVIVPSQVIFPADAEAKTKTLDKIRDTLRRAREKATEREDPRAIDEIDEIESWFEIEGPPQPDQLPPWLAATLVAKDGSVGKSGIIYVPLRGSDADAMERLAAWLDELRAQHPNVTFASAAALLGEVTPSLIRDAPWILGLVFLGLVLATGVASRSLVVTRDVFLATAMSAIFFGAALDLLSIELHLYNLLAVPVVIGLSVDGAVHVRWAQTYDARRQYATYKAVAASTLTSMVAFAALMTASHPGIRSLGTVGVLGLAISLLVNLVWLRMWADTSPADWSNDGIEARSSGQRI